jgi:hypothetical protein
MFVSETKKRCSCQRQLNEDLSRGANNDGDVYAAMLPKMSKQRVRVHNLFYRVLAIWPKFQDMARQEITIRKN